MADDRGTELLAVNIAFFVVAATIVLLRCYTRVVISKAFGVDDWLMMAACTFFLGYVICSNSGVRYGTGRHRTDLTEENYAEAKRYWWLCYIFFGLTMVMAKLSFGTLLLRIVCRPAHCYTIYGTSALVIVAGIIFFFVTLLQCQPISRYWHEDQPGHCIPQRIIVDLGYLYSSVSVLTDLIFALLPAFVVWPLQLRRRIRWVVMILMALGCLASAAVFVRIAYLRTFLNPDFLWATLDIAIWSTIEMGLAISAASFSTLRPLARALGWSVGNSAAYGSEPSGGNSRSTGPLHNSHTRPPQPVHLGNHTYIRSGPSEDTLSTHENHVHQTHTIGIAKSDYRPQRLSGTNGGVELTTLDDQKDDGSTGRASVREFIA